MDQGGHQPRLFGYARAHHGDKDHGYDAEAGKVGHEGGEDKADTLRGQQAANGNRLLLNFELGIPRFGRKPLKRLGRIDVKFCLHALRHGHGDLFGYADAHRVENRRQNYDTDNQIQEHQNRMGDFVADSFDGPQPTAGLRLFCSDSGHERLLCDPQ